ncbi:unnamed protein product [Caenorhabditis nigoni]
MPFPSACLPEASSLPGTPLTVSPSGFSFFPTTSQLTERVTLYVCGSSIIALFDSVFLILVPPPQGFSRPVVQLTIVPDPLFSLSSRLFRRFNNSWLFSACTYTTMLAGPSRPLTMPRLSPASVSAGYI